MFVVRNRLQQTQDVNTGLRIETVDENGVSRSYIEHAARDLDIAFGQRFNGYAPGSEETRSARWDCDPALGALALPLGWGGHGRKRPDQAGGIATS